jgi:alkylated DNA repair dioxygenase AlkB
MGCSAVGSGAAGAIPLMDICNGRANGHMQTDMFQPEPQDLNLLPSDGELNDFGRVFCGREADIILHRLLRDVPWQADTALVNGQFIKSGRQVAWYANDKFRYTHSGLLREAILWDLPILELIKSRVERVTGATFNSCVLNLYHNGSQGMGWHSDREAVGAHSLIASVSVGATRKFALRHKLSGEKRALLLEHGQLIVMRGTTQQHWLHALMRTQQTLGPRISLTFRLFPAHEDWS